MLKNKLNISHQVELAKAEEKISKQKARQLFDSGDINKVDVGKSCKIRNVIKLLSDCLKIESWRLK